MAQKGFCFNIDVVRWRLQGGSSWPISLQGLQEWREWKIWGRMLKGLWPCCCEGVKKTRFFVNNLKWVLQAILIRAKAIFFLPCLTLVITTKILAIMSLHSLLRTLSLDSSCSPYTNFHYGEVLLMFFIST